MPAPPAYWCHICMRTVPASEATTHVHDRECATCGGEDGDHWDAR